MVAQFHPLSRCLYIAIVLQEGSLSVDLHNKPTDTHQYLSANSCHPRHCKSSIPLSQALRIRRICSTDEKIVSNYNNTSGYLQETPLMWAVKHVCDVSWESLLTLRQRTNKTNQIPLITTFLPNLQMITRSLLPVSSPLTRAPVITFKHPFRPLSRCEAKTYRI